MFHSKEKKKGETKLSSNFTTQQFQVTSAFSLINEAPIYQRRDSFTTRFLYLNPRRSKFDHISFLTRYYQVIEIATLFPRSKNNRIPLPSIIYTNNPPLDAIKPARIHADQVVHLSRWKRGNEPCSTAILRSVDLSSKAHPKSSFPSRHKHTASNSSRSRDQTRRDASIHPISFTRWGGSQGEGNAWPLAKSVWRLYRPPGLRINLAVGKRICAGRRFHPQEISYLDKDPYSKRCSCKRSIPPRLETMIFRNRRWRENNRNDFG